jgi:transposase-like protein
MAAIVPSHKGFRCPVEIISHCVWLHHRFPPSFREVKEMMMERGVAVSHESDRGAVFRHPLLGTVHEHTRRPSLNGKSRTVENGRKSSLPGPGVFRSTSPGIWATTG